MADITYMSLRHWHTIKQRPQHLAEGLARRHRVVFIDPAGVWRFGRKQRTLGSRGAPASKLEQVGPNLYRYVTPLAWFPFSYHLDVANRVNHYLASRQLRSALRPLGWQHDLLWTSAPEHVAMIGALSPPGNCVCYDCMDLYRLFWSNPLRRKLIDAQEARLVARADFVLASSQILRGHILALGQDAEYGAAHRAVRVHLVRNGAEAGHFEQAVPPQAIPAEVREIPGVVAGYVGTISRRLDVALIEKVLEAYPELSVVCIGPTEIDLAPWRGIDRLHFLGARPYDDLPHYLARFQVLLIPHVLDEFVQAMNSVKVYEYLATGKPVVATALRELEPLRKVCYVAADDESFIAAVGTALAEGQEPERDTLPAQRRRVARKNTWDSRVAQINDILDEELARQK
jgi:glycosyltransferase involved in cell wall biosynthesis